MTFSRFTVLNHTPNLTVLKSDDEEPSHYILRHYTIQRRLIQITKP